MKAGLAGMFSTLALSGQALAAQYFVYAGSYATEPSSGAAPALSAGRVAQPPWNVPARGVSPRNITISPDNDFLFAANQTSGTITVFAIDHRTGHLEPVDAQMTMSQPGGISVVAAEH